MHKIILKVDDDIFKKYPETAIGYVQIDNLDAVRSKNLPQEIIALPDKAIQDNSLNLQNLVEQPTIKAWRSIYQNCGVKPKTYKSSIESLLRRFLKNDYKGIHTAVDMYNYISAGLILPMGGYNLKEIVNYLTLRSGKGGDAFTGLNGQSIPVKERHIVYADEKSVVCWLWNHRDCSRTMLHEDTSCGLFIVDSLFRQEGNRLDGAMKILSETMTGLGASVVATGTLTRSKPEQSIN